MYLKQVKGMCMSVIASCGCPCRQCRLRYARGRPAACASHTHTHPPAPSLGQHHQRRRWSLCSCSSPCWAAPSAALCLLRHLRHGRPAPRRRPPRRSRWRCCCLRTHRGSAALCVLRVRCWGGRPLGRPTPLCPGHKGLAAGRGDGSGERWEGEGSLGFSAGGCCVARAVPFKGGRRPDGTGDVAASGARGRAGPRFHRSPLCARSYCSWNSCCSSRSSCSARPCACTCA